MRAEPTIGDVARDPRAGDRVVGGEMTVEVLRALHAQGALTGVEARMTSPEAVAADTLVLGMDSLKNVLGSMGSDVTVTRVSRRARILNAVRDLIS